MEPSGDAPPPDPASPDPWGDSRDDFEDLADDDLADEDLGEGDTVASQESSAPHQPDPDREAEATASYAAGGDAVESDAGERDAAEDSPTATEDSTKDVDAKEVAAAATAEKPVRPPREPREPKPPGPLTRAMSGLPRPVRILLQVVFSVVGLALAGLFAIAWFASTEDLTFSAGEAGAAVSPGTVTITYVDDLECVPEPNTIYEPSAFSRWQQAYRLIDGDWVSEPRNFWDGEPEGLDSDSACGDDQVIEVPLPEGLPSRVALCRLASGCVEVTLG